MNATTCAPILALTTIAAVPATTPDGEWSGQGAVPAIGDRVASHVGTGTVVGYTVVDGYLGLHVNVDAPERWYTEQCDDSAPALVFGAEIRQTSPSCAPIAGVSAARTPDVWTVVTPSPAKRAMARHTAALADAANPGQDMFKLIATLIRDNTAKVAHSAADKRRVAQAWPCYGQPCAAGGGRG